MAIDPGWTRTSESKQIADTLKEPSKYGTDYTPTKEEMEKDPVFWASHVRKQQEVASKSAKRIAAEEASKQKRIDAATQKREQARAELGLETDWAPPWNMLADDYAGGPTGDDSPFEAAPVQDAITTGPEITILDSFVKTGMDPVKAAEVLLAKGINPNAPASELAALVDASKKRMMDDGDTPAEQMKARRGDLNKLYTEKEKADQDYHNTMVKFDREKSSIEQKFHGERLTLMKGIEALTQADAEDAAQHASLVAEINRDWDQGEILFEKGTRALFEKGMAQLGIGFNEDGTQKEVTPEKHWGIGPPGFTSADGSFSALRTAHSTLWILGALANTAVSVMSGFAGKKMSAIPNYLTDALFKAMDMDARVGTEKLSKINALSKQGVDAWSALNSSFRSQHERYAGLRYATAQSTIRFIDSIKSNPDYGDISKNPGFLKQVEELKERLKVYAVARKQEYKSSFLKHEWAKRDSDLKVWSLEQQARRDQSTAKLNQIKALEANMNKGKIKRMTQDERNIFSKFETVHTQLVRGLEIVKIIKQSENIQGDQLMGLHKIILADTQLAGTFGGGEESLAQELTNIGRLTGRDIMRMYEKGQTTDLDANFGYEQSWTAKQTVGYIEAILKNRLNIVVMGALTTRQLMDEQFHDRIDKILALGGIYNPEKLMEELTNSENGLVVSRMIDRGYDPTSIQRMQSNVLKNDFGY